MKFTYWKLCSEETIHKGNPTGFFKVWQEKLFDTVILSGKITEADAQFEAATSINPVKNRNISVTIEK